MLLTAAFKLVLPPAVAKLNEAIPTPPARRQKWASALTLLMGASPSPFKIFYRRMAMPNMGINFHN